MKNNVIIKIKIGIFLCIISLIYFAFFNFLLHGHLGLPYLGLPPFLVFLALPWFLIFYSFISVFVYPYIKIGSQSLFKRGLFFGLIIWIIDLPQILMDLRHALMGFDIATVIPSTLSFIKNPLYFIILGLVIGFCYKKFLSAEFNLPLEKFKIPFIKNIFAIILATLIYSFFMFFSALLIFYIVTQEPIFNYITDLLHPLFYIDPLIYGLIFTLFYTKVIGKANISKTKKWILFSIFISFFTTPLVLLFGELPHGFFEAYPLTHQFLLIPHLISIFITGYIFIKLFNEVFLTKFHLKLNSE